MDCASVTELMLADACGFQGGDIMFSANDVTGDEFALARRLGAYINLDDITHVDTLAQNGGVPETVCLRFNPGGTFRIGNAIMGDPGDAILWREDDGGLADEVNVIVNGEYQKSDLWPSCNWLYNVAVGGRLETRGSVAFLLPIGALVVLLVLDVRFPLLFWNLRHGLEVYGGEPTDWYYAMQRVSRITGIIGVFVLAAMSFAVH